MIFDYLYNKDGAIYVSNKAAMAKAVTASSKTPLTDI